MFWNFLKMYLNVTFKFESFGHFKISFFGRLRPQNRFFSFFWLKLGKLRWMSAASRRPSAVGRPSAGHTGKAINHLWEYTLVLYTVWWKTTWVRWKKTHCRERKGGVSADIFGCGPRSAQSRCTSQCVCIQNTLCRLTCYFSDRCHCTVGLASTVICC